MYPAGLQDLLGSERGVFALALAICSSVLVYFDKMPVQQWVEFNQWIGTALIGSKTVTTAMEIFTGRRTPKAEPPAPAPAAPTTTPVV